MAAKNTSVTTERMRPSSLGGIVLVLASIGVSIVSYGALGDTIRIRWTVGTYHHYGPEYVSTLPALLVFPVTVALLYICARWGKRYIRQNGDIESLDELHSIYDVLVLLLLGVVVTSQLVIAIPNL